MINNDNIRQQFPMIRNHPNLVYLDNGATTYKPDCVIQAVLKYYQEYTSNVERGDYETAIQADHAYEEVRSKVAKLINAKSEKEIVFTANVTASLNQVVYGLATQLQKGDIVYLTEGEHASNVLPWFHLQATIGIEIKYLPVDNVGLVQLTNLKLDKKTKVISLAALTNVLGTVQPIAELSHLVHAQKGYLLSLIHI